MALLQRLNVKANQKKHGHEYLNHVNGMTYYVICTEQNGCKKWNISATKGSTDYTNETSRYIQKHLNFFHKMVQKRQTNKILVYHVRVYGAYTQ